MCIRFCHFCHEPVANDRPGHNISELEGFKVSGGLDSKETGTSLDKSRPCLKLEAFEDSRSDKLVKRFRTACIHAQTKLQRLRRT
jgi:hypothetical protein